MRSTLASISLLAAVACGGGDKPSERGAAKGKPPPARAEFDDARHPAFLFGATDKRYCAECTPAQLALRLRSASGATERATAALSTAINPSLADGRATAIAGVAHFNLQIPWEATATFDGKTRPASPRRQYATSEFEFWRVAAPAPSLEAALAKVRVTPGPLEPTEVARWPIAITGRGGTVVKDEIVATVQLRSDQLAAASAGRLLFAGETAATAGGVLDTLEQQPFYQGPAGPLSNARYVAVVKPAAPRDVSCGRYSNGKATVTAKAQAYDLDVTVRDRFGGSTIATRHFAAEVDCAKTFTTGSAPGSGVGEGHVDRAAVRAWIGSVVAR